MKLVTIATALLVYGASGLVGAAPPSGTHEEVQDVSLDFREAGGEQYYIKCHNHARKMKDCNGARVYQETNDLDGLQTTPQLIRGTLFPPDEPTF